MGQEKLHWPDVLWYDKIKVGHSNRCRRCISLFIIGSTQVLFVIFLKICLPAIWWRVYLTRIKLRYSPPKGICDKSCFWELFDLLQSFDSEICGWSSQLQGSKLTLFDQLECWKSFNTIARFCCRKKRYLHFSLLFPVDNWLFYPRVV